MDIKSILRKNDTENYCFQQNEDYLIILLDEAGNVCILNNISQFLYQNCEDRNVEELIQLLYDQLIDKEELDFNVIMNDCIEAINEMVNAKLIYIVNPREE